MCGVIGTLGFVPGPEHRASGLAALRRRGPDAAGEVCGHDFWLAHTSLSIKGAATEPNRQPLVDRHQRLAFAFNGEVYVDAAGHLADSARREITAFAAATAEAFNGSFADFDRLQGDFAVAAVRWDQHGCWERALLCRDRVGVKPLYVVRTKRGCAFSSSLKALVAARLAQAEPDPDAIAMFLRSGSVPQPLTALRSVESLLPGESRVLTPGAQTRRQAVAPRHRAGGFLDVALESVRAQCHDGLARGETMHVFLSGGIDSMLLAMMGLRAGARVQGHCLKIARGPLDESAGAAESARMLGIPLDVIALDDTCIGERSLEFLAASDQPTVDGLNAFLVFAGAQIDERIVFTGTGLDELYFGYSWIVDLLRDHLGNGAPPVGALASAWEHYTSYIPSDRVSRLMHRSALPQAWDGCDPGPEHPLEQRLRAICLRRFTADRLLRDLDDVAMHHGKEARVPFLAAPVLAHAQSLDLLDLFPRGLTADGGDYRSSPLKQHVVDAALGLLPRGSCLGRRKQGFILPLDLITAGPLSERLSRALSPSRSPVASLIDLDLLHALRRRSSHGDHTFEDWLLLALAEWLGSLDRCLGLTGVLPQVKLQSAFAIGGM